MRWLTLPFGNDALGATDRNIPTRGIVFRWPSRAGLAMVEFAVASSSARYVVLSVVRLSCVAD